MHLGCQGGGVGVTVYIFFGLFFLAKQNEEKWRKMEKNTRLQGGHQGGIQVVRLRLARVKHLHRVLPALCGV